MRFCVPFAARERASPGTHYATTARLANPIYLTKVRECDPGQIQQVRRFNRLVAQRVGALDDSYLRRGRPLGEARLIFEVAAHGADVRALRDALGLDSGYLSRLLRSLKAQSLVEVAQADRATAVGGASS